MFSTPSGKPAACRICANSTEVTGANGDGL